eukprot:scaffold13756_cov97-Cylindrotheca_fusiformis.AAC.3
MSNLNEKAKQTQIEDINDPDFFVYSSETKKTDMSKDTLLTHLRVDSSVTEIPARTFWDCEALVQVQFPDTLTRIHSHAFYGCKSLATVKLPSSVIKIDDSAFCFCPSLTSLEFSHGLLEIGNFAFCSCDSFETIHIPSTVHIVGKGAFQFCHGLKCIKRPRPWRSLKNICSVDAEGWNTSRSSKRIPPSVVDRIGTNAFSFCEQLISIELPDQRFSNVKENWDLGILSSGGIRGSNQLDSKIGRIVDGLDDFLRKTIHRFDKCPLNKLCYYQSYYSLDEAMMKLGSLMEDDPLAATTQVDEFGMTPLHILSLSQTPNLSMLLAVMNGGHPDHIILGKDSFGSTPMDY